MKTQTSEIILQIVKKRIKVRPDELKRDLNMTAAAVHRQLKKMVDSGRLVKQGASPLVFYSLPPSATIEALVTLSDSRCDFINNRYMYISPQGNLLNGVGGFVEWAKKNNPTQSLDSLAAEYQKIAEHADTFLNKDKVVDGMVKLMNTFGQVYVDEVVYQDFYSLPKFGKTKLGQMVLYAKQAQDINMISTLAKLCGPVINRLIKTTKPQAVIWTPHSLPRKLQLLKELRRQIALSLPEVAAVKSYRGDVAIAQKSLSKLEERIENARETIFIKGANVPYSSILLIDDALGSGATVNELARKLKTQYAVKKIYAFVIVGSYKGFEVIKEV